ncbi:hypothetical protein HZ326_31675 [Fusarium oxysporum f. sp. albedinis]|nr:hypothetical protein HZ326_31675 [Fusarium oxysporum f. sp. albedinis]
MASPSIRESGRRWIVITDNLRQVNRRALPCWKWKVQGKAGEERDPAGRVAYPGPQDGLKEVVPKKEH